MIAKNPGITVIKAKEVHKTGVDGVYQRLENKYHSYDAIYVTIDIDVLDPAFAPGTGTPHPGGLPSLQMIELFQMILKGLPIKALDIVEVAPDLDVNNITSWAALRLIHELFAHFSK